jgi:thiol-disulfide isomerase/thioredoxin
MLLAAAWLGCPGCSDSATGPTTKHVVRPREPAPFQLAIVDRAKFDDQIARLRGRVVLVDCWASWCVPCVEQLPHAVESSRRHRDAGLAVVTLSMDSPQDFDQVRAVLIHKGAGSVTNLISEFGAGSESADAFDVPGGALPHYKLYDRTGKLRRTFGLDPAAKRQFTMADVDAAVAELLAE